MSSVFLGAWGYALCYSPITLFHKNVFFVLKLHVLSFSRIWAWKFLKCGKSFPNTLKPYMVTSRRLGDAYNTSKLDLNKVDL